MTEAQHRPDESQLVDAVADMADADPTLSEEAKLLVIAALDGEDTLADALEGDYDGRIPDRGIERTDVRDTNPAGAFLKSIKARGFRGIGPESDLSLHPAPGLTIVAGRNGSGKSSFSEALELALTGDTYRWNRKNKQSATWSQHWRNLHDGEPCQVRVELAEEGIGTTTVGVDWADGPDLMNRKTWVQRAAQRRQAGVSGLGWSRALELYQPILSYDELGGLLQAGPSKLFDKLDAILGIEQATDAERRLAEALKELQEPDKAAKAEVRELKKVLAALDDPRAAAALDLVRKHHPDLDAVQAIATGTSPEPAGDLARLKALARLQLPTEQEVREAAEALREAADECAQASFSSVDIAARRTVLLRQALEFHTHRGDGPCPVCRQGRLDTEWHERIKSELATEDEELARHQKAQQSLEQVRRAARALLGRVAEPAQPGRFELESLEAARMAWQRWTRPPEGDAACAEHLDAAFGGLEAAHNLLREEAATVLAQHEDAWAPLAVRLARWVDLARQAEQNEPKVRLVESAHEFMKRTVEQLRDGRMGQLEAAARDIWAALKQESNVDLGKIELKGTATRRRVELYADVDGEDAQALGVMSQGELHALALALFLPRATMDGSPFRFIVLDDPIQAMDPAKVDGFVRVLAKLAEDRQVVVFSHDDRLPQAVRQMGVHARILQVCRDANSGVEVTACMDPARRFLADAFAVAKDPGIAVDVKARVLPGVCRMAVEAAARDAYMARHFAAGDQRVDVEEVWQAAEGTSRRLALALHDDKEADLSGWLNAERWRRPARQIVTKATHEGLTRDPVGAVLDVERMVADLKASAR